MMKASFICRENTFQRQSRIVGGHYFQGHYWQVAGWLPYAQGLGYNIMRDKNPREAAKAMAAKGKMKEGGGGIGETVDAATAKYQLTHLFEAPDRPPVGQLLFILSNPKEYIEMLRSFDHDVVFEEKNRYLTGSSATFLELPDDVLLKATTAELIGAAPLPPSTLTRDDGRTKLAPGTTAAGQLPDPSAPPKEPKKAGEGGAVEATAADVATTGEDAANAKAEEEEEEEDAVNKAKDDPPLEERDQYRLLMRWWPLLGPWAREKDMLLVITRAIIKDMEKDRMHKGTAHALLAIVTDTVVHHFNEVRATTNSVSFFESPLEVPKETAVPIATRCEIAATFEKDMAAACEFLLDAKLRTGIPFTQEHYGPLLKMLPNCSDADRVIFSDYLCIFEGGSRIAGQKRFSWNARAGFMKRVVIPFLAAECAKLVKHFWRFILLYTALFVAAIVGAIWYYTKGFISINWAKYPGRRATDYEQSLSRQERYEYRKEVAIRLGDDVENKRLYRRQGISAAQLVKAAGINYEAR